MPGTLIRLRTGGRLISGPLQELTDDTLFLDASGREAIPREAVDTVWRRAGSRGSGAAAGAAFGGGMAGLILLAGHSSGEPETAGGIALGVGLGALVLGLVVSSASPAWELVYAREAR
jgi:hypothetical protein